MYTQQFKDCLWSLIQKRADSDPLFNATLSKENKSYDKCLKFLSIEVRKQATNNCACLCDDDMMNIVVHYYTEDSIDQDLEKQQAPIFKTQFVNKTTPLPTKKKKTIEQPSLFDCIENQEEKEKEEAALEVAGDISYEEAFKNFDFNAFL